MNVCNEVPFQPCLVLHSFEVGVGWGGGGVHMHTNSVRRTFVNLHAISLLVTINAESVTCPKFVLIFHSN